MVGSLLIEVSLHPTNILLDLTQFVIQLLRPGPA